MAKQKINDVLQNLKLASRGAVYVSETDSTPEAFRRSVRADATTEYIKRKLTGTDHGPIEEVDANDFFERITAKKDWHNDREETNRRRWEKLYRILTENLTELRVLKAGTIQIEIIVYGRDGDGAICGIRMKAVET